MPALLDNYSPNAGVASLLNTMSTTQAVCIEDKPRYNTSINYIARPSLFGLVNSRHLQTLDAIAKLEDDWDLDGAKKPAASALNMARFITFLMNATNQKIFNIVPGPRGEILVDIRNRSKSLELLFYPNKMKFVKFDDNSKPEQGEFSISLLPELVSWVNS